MGIHLSSIAQINSSAPDCVGVKYFVYLINYYNIEDNVIDEFLTQMSAMDSELSKFGNAVSVSLVKNIDFASDLISWNNCFGIEADEVCPAILICTLPPLYFIPRLLAMGAADEEAGSRDVPWILLSLKERGRSAADLTEIVLRVVKEVSTGADLSDFARKRMLRTIDNRPVINGEVSAGSWLPSRDALKRFRGA